jgi:glutamate/tyrosine decarboxylase-like PLP-dependent enzyme
MTGQTIQFPAHGKHRDEILSELGVARQHDVQWQDGKAFSLVYRVDDEVGGILKDAYTMFFSENGLNPMAFPSLRKFETEVVAMSAGLLGGDEGVTGTMTSGGTDSILMAVLAAREWGRQHRPHVAEPEMLLPASAHPAFDKAGHYFGVKAVRVPVGPDLRADVDAMRRAITSRTILMAGSAPAYPHGVVDPIEPLAAAAKSVGILFHTDACVGGFVLPFVRRLGYPVPGFDFNVPGVTSISADLHKYAYAAKGASVILYRHPELRRGQFFATVDWSGGIYASPGMSGTRPGGAIAAAWAILNFLGEDGYLRITDTVMKTTQKIRQGIEAIPELKVLSNPEMSVMAIASDRLNIYEVADELAERGWHIDRQQFPPSLHLTVNYAHAAVADQFLQDLAQAVSLARRPGLRKARDAALLGVANAAVKALPESVVSRMMERAGGMLGGSNVGSGRSAPMYGMIGTLPNRGDVHELVLDLLDQMMRAS